MKQVRTGLELVAELYEVLGRELPDAEKFQLTGVVIRVTYSEFGDGLSIQEEGCALKQFEPFELPTKEWTEAAYQFFGSDSVHTHLEPGNHPNFRCVVRPITGEDFVADVRAPSTGNLAPLNANPHTLRSCKGCDIGCNFCHGGLSYCETCHGGESDLPTECPGRAMVDGEMISISAGDLDFIGGVWVKK